MILFKNVLIASIVSLFSITSCAQKKEEVNSNQKEMEKEIINYQNKMYDKIQKFDKKPLYILQVNKNNCRILITCNDIPHWMTFFENSGESNPVYLNNYISKSANKLLQYKFIQNQDKNLLVIMQMWI